jgi:rhodanese-related sulfurtransferase
MEHAVRVPVTGEAVVARRMIRGPRAPLRRPVARQAPRLALRERMVGVGRQARGSAGHGPQPGAGGGDEHSAEQQPVGTAKAHRRMLPSPAVRRELLRDAVIYVAAVAVLGAAANLIPTRHMAWWGRGKQPPTEGTDFTFIDPVSAETLRQSLPGVLFLDTRDSQEYAASHIPGALRVSYTDLERSLTPELLARLRAADTVVIYGDSAETDVEQLVAQELRLRGLPPPMVMIGGFAAWQAGHPAETGEGTSR